MASVASQLKDEVTAHAPSDSIEDAREICAGGTFFPNKLLDRKTPVRCYGTRRHTGVEVKGKLANPLVSHCLHTTSENSVSTITTADTPWMTVVN